jgi:hypothetical protein
VIALTAVAAALLGTVIATTVVLAVHHRDTRSAPVDGGWTLSAATAGWRSTDPSATMRIAAPGTVEVHSRAPGRGCTGTVRGGDRTYRMMLRPGCDTGDPTRPAVLDATLDAAGGQLTVTAADTGAGSRWTRR